MATLFKCKMVVGYNPRFFSTTSQRLSQRYVFSCVGDDFMLLGVNN